MTTDRVSPAAQVEPARKAADVKAAAGKRPLPDVLNDEAKRARRAAARKADLGRDRHDREHVHGGCAPPVRLLDRHQVCEIANLTYPTLWKKMRAGHFPRSRIFGGRSMWLSDEVEQWVRSLPLRPLKGDTPAADDATSPNKQKEREPG